MSGSFFIIGAFRSGTTAIARILDLADNATVHVEQSPKLSREARLLYEGRLDDPAGVLQQQKGPAIAIAHEAGVMYADKNANYLPFAPLLKPTFGSRLVFVVRDGTSVVRSMMDWENVVPSGFYRRAEDADEYPEKSVADDFWDYSLIRPRPDTAAAAAWKSMSHFAKLCWYWTGYNQELRSMLDALPKSDWRLCHMDRMNTAAVFGLAEFLGLTGLDEDRVQNALEARINASDSRGTVDEPFPTWENWRPDQQAEFTSIAGESMRALGYWPDQF